MNTKTMRNDNQGVACQEANTNGVDDDIVYAFSSVSRELYRKDIYASLALPPKSRMRFRYEKSWWGKNIEHLDDNNDISKLKGMGIVVIAASFPGYEKKSSPDKHDIPSKDTGYTFYPVRMGKIKDAQVRSNTLYLDFELTIKFVDYDKIEPQDIITSQESYPRFGKANDDTDAFVCSQPHDFEFSPENNSADPHCPDTWSNDECEERWNQIINELGKNSAFAGTLFYRFVKLSEINEESPKELTQLFGSENYGYELSSGGEYLLDFSLAFAGDPPEGADDYELLIETSDKIQVLPNKFLLGLRTDEKEVILDPSTGLEPHSTLLTFRADTSSKINIPLQVQPSSKKKYGPFGLLFGGLLIVIASSEIVSVLIFLYLNVLDLNSRLVSRELLETLFNLFGTALSVLSIQLYGAYKS